MYNIDIGLINSAYLYYLLRGYEPLSAPLLVDKDVLDITLPEGRHGKQHLDKFYVGSAEQSFYQLMKDGLEPKGKYMMLTPCQRDEEASESHLEIFLKLELISISTTPQNIAKDAFDFYKMLGEEAKLVSKEGFCQYDLEIGGVEVGSYGCRMYDSVCVSYGTGLALPRFSQARSRNKGIAL